MAKTTREIAEEQARQRQQIADQQQRNPGRPVVENDAMRQAAIDQAKAARKAADTARATRTVESRGTGWVDTGVDVAKAGGSGVAKGVGGTPGAVVDIYRLGQLARAYTASRGWFGSDPRYATGDTQATLALQDEERRRGERPAAFMPETVKKWGGQGWNDYWKEKGVPGLDYEAKTDLGNAAGVAGEIAGGAVTGGIGGAGRSGVRQIVRGAARDLRTGAIAGTAAGGAEYLTGDPTVGTATSLIAGPLAASYGRRSAEGALAQTLAGMSQQQIDSVERIFANAQRANIPLTKANIADYVTAGGTNASELQRVVESGNRDAVRQFFRDNGPPGPTRVRAYGENVLNEIDPRGPSREPSTIGPRVAEAQSRVIDNANARANAQVRPQYQQFEQGAVDPAIMQTAMADPVWARTAQEVMQDPELASFLQTTAQPGTVGFMQLVQQRIGKRREDLLRPSQGEPDRQRAEGIRPSEEMGARMANAASWQQPPGAGIPQGQGSPLERADAARAAAQDRQVRPLEAGPEGQAAAATTTEGVGQAMLPPNPREGSHVEVGRAVSNLVGQNPDLARELVRNELGTRFNDATTRNVNGEPYSAGTKFWQSVAGNQQERDNLQAMITALPNGQATWSVVRDMGEIFEAMGKRQTPGSKTASNLETQEALKGNSWVETLGKFTAGGLDSFKEAYGRWALGSNMDEISSIIMDPNRAADFERIARLPPNSAARGVAIRQFLISMQPQAGQAAAARQTTDEPINWMRVPSGPPQPEGAQ